MSGRFEKGRSGNPAGRPKARRPSASAFDIIFDKTLTVVRDGEERELTVDEALELRTYQAAIKGSKLAMRAVLKMIEKREVALAKLNPRAPNPVKMLHESDCRNADQAMLLLAIAERNPKRGDEWGKYDHLLVATWAAQAGLSRPGRRRLTGKKVEEINRSTVNPAMLKWPRGRVA